MSYLEKLGFILKTNHLQKILILSLMAFMSINFSYAQILFSESFNDGAGAVNGNDDTGGVGWSTSCPDCLPGGFPGGANDFYKIVSNSLRGQDTNGPATFETNPIDISSCSGNIRVTFDISESGTMEACNTGCVSGDWVAFQYNIDGGGWQDPANSFFCGGTCANLNVIQSDDVAGVLNYDSGCLGTGSTIQIRIIVQCWAASEIWIIDNVQVICDTGNDAGSNGSVSVCSSASPLNLFDELGGTPDAGGTWSGPSVLANGDLGTFDPATDAAGTYTYTVGAGACAVSSTVDVSFSASITPAFDGISPICAGDPLAPLPTTSNNGITGSWSPALNNTATTTYTFTPDAGQCATTTTLTITVNPNVTPTFNPVTDICSGDALAALPTTSTNGITGSWSPALDNTATTTYTFTPDAGQCATTTTLTITVNPNVTPTFNPVADICAGDALAALPSTSTNGITGSWSPALDNTATTTYTFTPDAGQCATTTTLTITVNTCAAPIVVPAESCAPLENFDAAQVWTFGGTNSSWNWGNPDKTFVTDDITGGGNCLILGANTPAGLYNVNENSWAQSPEYDLTAANNPYLDFDFWFENENSSNFDEIFIEYSINGGTTWTILETAVGANVCYNENWYNHFSNWGAGSAGCFSGGPAPTGWIHVKKCINQVANQPSVIFRFRLTAGSTCQHRGATVDNWVVCDETVTANADFSCNGPLTVDFSDLSLDCPDQWLWDFGDGNTSNAQNPTHTYAACGTYTVSLTATVSAVAGDGCGPVSDTYTFDVEVLEASVLSSNDPICPGGSDGDATSNVCGNTGGVNLVWSPAPGSGQGTNSIGGLSSGTYDLTATPVNPGCPSTVSVTITDPIPPVAGTNGVITLCETDPQVSLLTQLGGMPDAGGSWSGPSVLTGGDSGDFDPVVNTGGTYTYSVGPGACPVTADVVVTLNSELTPTFNPVAAICSGDALAALPTTSTNGITGSWSPALDNTATTTYTFTPDAGQCATTTTLTITVNSTSSSTQNIDVCSGSNYTYADGTVSNNITVNESHVSTLVNAAGCDSLLTENLNVTAVITNTLNIDVCSGDNYTYADGTISNNIIANESNVSTLVSASGCDSLVTENLNVVGPFSSSTNVDVCSGSNYTYLDGTVSNNITTNESHVSTLVSAAGCDSLVTENLNVVAGITNTVNVDVCSGGSYTYADGSTSNNITVNESLVTTLVAASGCDSIVTENVNVIGPITNTVAVDVCSGSNYTYADGTVSNNIAINESHVSTLVAASGCDSVLTENLNVLAAITNSVNMDVCSGANYTYADGTVSNNILVNESYTSTLVAASGCDSLVTENLNVVASVTNSLNVDLCSGSNYTYADGMVSNNITVNESHVSTLVSFSGCDSILTENINIVTAVTNSINIDICSGSSYTYADGTVSNNITINESYVSTLVAVSGCDSILTENLNVLPVVSNTVDVHVCSGADYTYADGTQSTNILVNESQVSTLVAANGCDSLLTENIIVDPTYNIVDDQIVCENTTFVYPDGFSETITGNTSHVSNLVTSEGCDSIITTNVTMSPNAQSTQNYDICSGASFTYADGTQSTNITVNESYVSNLISSNGCDSLVTENVNVVQAISVVVDTSICTGSNYTFADGANAVNLLQDQTYVSTLVASSGCDSIVTENITVLPTPFVNLNDDLFVCEGDEVVIIANASSIPVWNNGDSTLQISFIAITDTFVVANVSDGCGSGTDTLYINVNPLPTIDAGPDVTIPLGATTQLQASGGLSYVWSPNTYLDCSDCEDPISGPLNDMTYIVMGQDTNGCVNYDTVNIRIDGEIAIYIPNIFSPNGDGENDLFKVFGASWSTYNMKIFNRWGSLIFESNDPNMEWDGKHFKSGVPCPQAVFVYKFRGTTILGQVIERAGNVMLTR